MRYVSKGGEELTPAAWRKLYLNPRYATLDLFEKDDVRIVCSWIGLAFDCEREPMLYLVQFDKPTRKKDDEPAVYWFPNQREAVRCFDRLREQCAA